MPLKSIRSITITIHQHSTVREKSAKKEIRATAEDEEKSQKIKVQ
jgi:hypothetical protein